MVTLKEMHEMERVVVSHLVSEKGGVHKVCGLIRDGEDFYGNILDMTVDQLEEEYNRIMDVPIAPIRAKDQCNKGEE